MGKGLLKLHYELWRTRSSPIYYCPEAGEVCFGKIGRKEHEPVNSWHGNAQGNTLFLDYSQCLFRFESLHEDSGGTKVKGLGKLGVEPRDMEEGDHY